MKEEADTLFLQSGEVNWPWSSCGSGVGWGFAWGARRQKTCQRKRDWASAISLWTPGTCLAEKDMEKPAAGNTKSRSKCIKAGTLEVLEFRMCTSASLSQRNKMCCRGHWAPHFWAARTTRNIPYKRLTQASAGPPRNCWTMRHWRMLRTLKT